MQLEPEPAPPAQFADVVDLADAEGVDRLAAHQHQVAAHQAQLAGVEQHLGRGRQRGGVGGVQQHHRAARGQRRLEARDRGQRPARLQFGPAFARHHVRLRAAEPLGTGIGQPPQRRRRALAGFQPRRQRLAPGFQQRRVGARGHHQQVAVAGLLHLAGRQHRQPRGRGASDGAELAQRHQRRLQFGGLRRVGQHQRGLRQVGELREREAAVGEERQVRQRGVVFDAREVERRVGIDRRLRAARGGAALAVVAGRQLESELQLVVAAELEGRHREAARDLRAGRRGERQRQALAGAARAGRCEPERLHVAVVDRHAQHALAGFARRRVAEAQVDRHARRFPGEDVGRQPQVDADGLQLLAAHLQRRRVGHEVAQAHLAAGLDEVRRVVGGTRRRQLHRAHAGAFAAQRRLAQHQGLRRLFQLRRVTPQHQQQLGGRIVGQAGHHQRGHLHARQLHAGQRGRALVVRGQHHRVALRGGVVQHREDRAPVGRERAEPRSQQARRLHGRQAGLAREDEGQLEPAAVARVEEGRGQQRQVVAQHEPARHQFQRAVVADAGPQAGVLRELAVHRVVPDELQVQLGEIDEVARIELDLGALRRAQRVLLRHHGGQRLAVDQHAQLRQLGQQRRREGVVELQPRTDHRLVQPQRQRQVDAVLDAAQLDRAVGADVAQAHGLRDEAGG